MPGGEHGGKDSTQWVSTDHDEIENVKIFGSSYPLSIAFIVVNEFCERFSYYGMKAVLTLYFLYFLHWNEDTSTAVYHAFSSLCYFTPILGAAIADSWLGKFNESKDCYRLAIYIGDVKCFGDDCYALAFGVPGLLMVVALVVFTMGSKTYRKPPPEGNIVAQVIKCIWFAICNRYRNRSGNIPKRQHWLDWAAEKYPKHLIMDVKALTRILFLYIPLPMFWALLDQQVLNPFLVLIFIPLFDLIIYRLISKCRINFSSLRKMTVGMILASLAFAVAGLVEIKINGPKNEITQLEKEVTHPEAMKFDVHTGVKRDYKRFFILQNTTHYSKLHLETKIQDLHFHLKYNNLSVYNENSVEEKNCYHLVVHEDEGSISSVLVKDIGIKPDNRMTAIRFINTLHKDINISLDADVPLSVGKDYGMSAYKTVLRGEYPAVHFKTEDRDFFLNLGLLDFGTTYLFVITNITNQGLQTWKTEEISANKLSIAWQLPQYILVTAAEVMFSITGLEFSYSQAPSSMKSVLQAAWLLTVAVGNVIVLVVAQFSGLVQWAEFILFSCLLLAVCLIFSIMGYYYVPLTSERVHKPMDKQVPHTQGSMLNLETKNTRL
ncbi:Solute carrier family 15 member 2 [Cricetulus griseus]|uniref:Solute carrier family 15 member 2 n=1 Tax=Cricetulus griseus TaxID=10029 RepID=G3HAJ4_CRIGR|nr:Solute carrier family 15 member 2 [Cricetulus griseus]